MNDSGHLTFIVMIIIMIMNSHNDHYNDNESKSVIMIMIMVMKADHNDNGNDNEPYCNDNNPELNAHLFSLHVHDTEQCACGHLIEDTSHYLLHCPLYGTSREKLFIELRHMDIGIDIDTLLYGDDSHSFDINRRIFQEVHRFISETGRL